MALKTDYKNYIPDANGRVYSITQNAQGKFVITDETNYAQRGDNFGANDINAITIAVNKLSEIVSVTIPADDTTNYTTLTDKDGVDYYNIQIPVAGMNADYVGTQPLTPKMIDPSDTTNFSIAEWEEVRDTYFPMIMSAWGRAGGYVDIYLYELPDKDFQVQLYGV